MAKKTWAPSQDALRKLSSHLLYEMRMTFALAQQLDAGAGTVLDPVARNFQVEAFAVHVRSMIDFLWSERRSDREDTDAYAADYFARDEWAALRPALPAAVDKAVQARIGWGVAHLTYDRVWVDPNEWWDVRDVASAMLPAFVRFVDAVDPGKFESGVHEALRVCVIEYDAFLNFREPGARSDR